MIPKKKTAGKLGARRPLVIKPAGKPEPVKLAGQKIEGAIAEVQKVYPAPWRIEEDVGFVDIFAASDIFIGRWLSSSPGAQMMLCTAELINLHHDATITVNAMTPGERRCFEFMRAYIRKHGNSPTTREIGEAIGTKSNSAVGHHIMKLKNKGMIADAMNSRRGYMLTPRGAMVLP